MRVMKSIRIIDLINSVKFGISPPPSFSVYSNLSLDEFHSFPWSPLTIALLFFCCNNSKIFDLEPKKKKNQSIRSFIHSFISFIHLILFRMLILESFSSLVPRSCLPQYFSLNNSNSVGFFSLSLFLSPIFSLLFSMFWSMCFWSRFHSHSW